MNIGIVSLTAMPSWGGAEIYLDRLNRCLNENEHISILYTATPEVEGYDNGSKGYHRIVLPHIEQAINDNGVKHGVSSILYNELNQLENGTNDWWDELEQHLCKQPKQDIGIVYVQTLYPENIDIVLQRLKPYFRNLITTSFDIEPAYIEYLYEENKKTPDLTLLETFERVKDKLVSEVGELNDSVLMSKQNVAEVDYHLHLTHFHQEIMQYLKPTKGYDFVLHPLVEEEWTRGIDYGSHYQPVVTDPAEYTLGAINPCWKKGKALLAQIIARTPHKYLILQGGWGNGEDFLNYLQEEYGTTFPDRVRLGDYSKDMIGYFDTLDAFLFPSWLEGYGQVAHESILRRTPVITTNYPTIHQATIGKGKYVPLTDYFNVEMWLDAIKDVFHNQEYWHFECNDGALMLLNRTMFNRQDFLQYLDMINQKEEMSHKHIANLISQNNVLED